MRRRFSVLLVVLWLSGCVPAPLLHPANDRPFRFEEDTLSFDNELFWDYIRDEQTGVMRTVRRDPPPTFAQRCYAMVRAARLFFQYARFDGTLPASDDAEYHRLVEAVMSLDPRDTDPVPRVVIPGYANLRSFSAEKGALIKSHLGTALDSYLQLGNWRMVFPFWEGHREETAQNLMAVLRVHRPPVVHLSTFPRETINHAVLLYGVEEDAAGVRFRMYDPNHSTQPSWLIYDRQRKDFFFPANNYFIGGRVDAYEMYHSPFY